MAHIGGFVWKFGTLGEGGEGVELNGRGGDRERGRGGERQGAEASRIAKGDVVVVIAHRVLLCKTGGVMRFGEHFCAADFYKSGFCRGKWVKIFLDLVSGAVGFLVTGAQRAWGEDPGRRPSTSSGLRARRGVGYDLRVTAVCETATL
jgi:hypothetical protein